MKKQEWFVKANFSHQALSNEIRLRRQYDRTMSANKVYLLVEGADDARLFANFVCSNCQIVFKQQGEYTRTFSGKRFVLETMRLLAREPYVLAIVDRDFDAVRGKNNYPVRTFTTDDHDLDVMICKAKLGDGTVAAIATRYNDERRSARPESFADRVLPLGCCRLENEINWEENENPRWALSFKELPYDLIIDTNEEIIRVEVLLDLLLAGRTVPPKNTVRKRIDAQITRMRNLMSKEPHIVWQLCQGHDLLNYVCRIVFADGCDERYLRKILRQKYQFADFFKTHLYAAVSRWEKDTVGLRVFRKYI